MTLHASCVAIADRGLLILGPSGSGKSSLALQLMALGATLIADDRTDIRAENGQLVARCPPPLHGLIEARGLGLLRAQTLPSARLHLIVDLGTPETDRLPPTRQMTLCDISVELVFGQRGSHFAAAILHYINHGRADRAPDSG